MEITKEKILDALKDIKHPESESNIVDQGIITVLEITENVIKVSLKFKKKKDPFAGSVQQAVERTILALAGENIKVKVELETEKPAFQQYQNQKEILKGVKNIIAVASGKGGVGKSTVAVNLAVAAAKSGAKVGLIDADIYGPSIPKMFQAEQLRPVMEKREDKDVIIPIEKYGVKILSVGFFVKPDDALVWRGPMATNALKQLMEQGDWDGLDFLFVDLPPGTSDIHLTLVQEVAVTGAVIVTTPQEVALADAIKGINMFRGEKVNVPVLGLVENMAWFTPAELPENKYFIFGKEGGKKLAESINVPLLGQIPLVQSIREGGDEGIPAATNEDSITGMAFRSLTAKMMEQVKIRNTQKATKKVEITRS